MSCMHNFILMMGLLGCIVSQLAMLQELYTVAFFVVGFITG